VTGRASRPWLVLLVVLGLGVLGATPSPGSGHADLGSASTSTVGMHASDLALAPATVRTALLGDADTERGDRTPTLLLVALGMVAMVYPARAFGDPQPDVHVRVPTGLVRACGARAPPDIRDI
jgi:hypothetical protein